MNTTEKIFHLETWFSGRVQGIGFRSHTLEVARGYEVCGEVRNLPDGRVYLRAEGQENEVRAFCEAVAARMQGFIRTTEDRETWREGHSSEGFRIGR